jgi:hypothetical protein
VAAEFPLEDAAERFDHLEPYDAAALKTLS